MYGNYEEVDIVDAITKKYETLSADIEESIQYEEDNMFLAYCKTNSHGSDSKMHLKLILYAHNVENQDLEFMDNTSVIAALINENDKCKVGGKL